jgi:hypothetical protein
VTAALSAANLLIPDKGPLDTALASGRFRSIFPNPPGTFVIRRAVVGAIRAADHALRGPTGIGVGHVFPAGRGNACDPQPPDAVH